MEQQLSKQATNSIRLYRGASRSSIERALSFQNKSVVEELMTYYHATSKEDLAFKLSIGAY